jgi:hypothetical protein
MSNDLIKPSRAIKGATTMVRAHSDAVDYAREIYLAQIARAEASYFERIERAMSLLHGEDAPSKTSSQPGPASEINDATAQ